MDVNIEGSGSGDGPIIDQVHMFGILPGPGDIRKKRGILEILGRKWSVLLNTISCDVTFVNKNYS